MFTLLRRQNGCWIVVDYREDIAYLEMIAGFAMELHKIPKTSLMILTQSGDSISFIIRPKPATVSASLDKYENLVVTNQDSPIVEKHIKSTERIGNTLRITFE